MLLTTRCTETSETKRSLLTEDEATVPIVDASRGRQRQVVLSYEPFWRPRLRQAPRAPSAWSGTMSDQAAAPGD